MPIEVMGASTRMHFDPASHRTYKTGNEMMVVELVWYWKCIKPHQINSCVTG